MDYNKTLNLPKTEFPMRASLPQREPEFLKGWEKRKLYNQLMSITRASRFSYCTTDLRMQTAQFISAMHSIKH